MVGSANAPTLTLDNLVVATDFWVASIPEASSFLFGGLALCVAGSVVALRRRPAAMVPVAA